MTSPPDPMLPARLDESHVHTVRAVTERLRGVARSYGGQADSFQAEVRRYTRWLAVPAPKAVRAAFGSAVAELCTEAGWCAYDSGVASTGHFIRAVRWADEAGDACGVVNAAWHAGVVLIRAGRPNDALKVFQLGHARLAGFAPSKPAAATDDPRIPTLTARLNRTSAIAYAVMGRLREAMRYLAKANGEWAPAEEFERASAALETARIQLSLGRLDAAEHSAASAVRTYREGYYRRGQIVAGLVLAEVHLRAGEPQGLTLAQEALTQVSTLHSLAVRRDLVAPLATALAARPDTEAQELARKARQLATPPPAR
jgi:tetratricopeptide (TPR) repeat protein